jgi:hypothetical protein
MIEKMIGSTFSSRNMHKVIDDNPYRNMVMDAMKMNKGYGGQYPIVDKKNLIQTRPCFFYLLKDFDEPLGDGCTNHHKLSVVA